ncbi:MAG: adenylate/guanylate cyclase domain-containing protein [Alphaproteobacteria bacterium]
MIRFLTHRWFHFLVLAGFLLASVYYSNSGQHWRNEMRYLVFDSLNRMYPREPTNAVVIVDIDDESLKRYGQWPWPRTVVADLVTALTDMGARVIAFDGVLAEPDRSSPRFVAQGLPDEPRFEALRADILGLPDHDRMLAEAIEKSGIFVSGFTYGSYTQAPRKPRLTKQILIRPEDRARFLTDAEIFRVAATFLPELEAASAGNGSFMASPDQDGILRRTGMVFSDGQALYPSLSLEALRVALGDRKTSVKIGRNPDLQLHDIDTNYRIVIGDRTIPVESDGQLWVYYRKFDERSGDYLSAFKLLDPAFREVVKPRIEGKIVLIGSSAEGLKDLRSTALERFQPGVEIHANVIEQALQGRYLLRPDVTVIAEASFILFAGFLMILLALFVNVIVLALVCFSMIGIAFVGSVSAYVDYGLLLDPFYPSVCVFLISIVSTLFTYLKVEEERRQVRSAFSHYISPDFMKELTKNPEKLRLGGDRRELSVLFSDIRGFTSICENMNPEDIIQLMNDFLTPMSDTVMRYRGTIDKYMGDAMMAFWNAPLDDEDHARHACRAALEMQGALEAVNEALRQRAETDGKKPLVLRAGIGINTGLCAVGNMGSRQRFAYSVLGDTVNLASRLEGQTKTYGVDVLIGEETHQQAPEFAMLEADIIRVKGKAKPERVYILLGDEDEALSGAFLALKACHEEMLSAYRTGDFKGALGGAVACAERGGYGLAAFYSLYQTRAQNLIDRPPEDEWSGIYEAETK